MEEGFQKIARCSHNDKDTCEIVLKLREEMAQQTRHYMELQEAASKGLKQADKDKAEMAEKIAGLEGTILGEKLLVDTIRMEEDIIKQKDAKIAEKDEQIMNQLRHLRELREKYDAAIKNGTIPKSTNYSYKQRLKQTRAKLIHVAINSDLLEKTTMVLAEQIAHERAKVMDALAFLDSGKYGEKGGIAALKAMLREER